MSDITDILPDNYIKGNRTEELEIEIKCCTYASPVYLRFKNDFGGIDYWLFDRENADVPEVKTIASYERPLQNIRTGDKLRVTEKSYIQTWICNTDFERENAEGFKQLLRSECVEYLSDVDDLASWVRVDVELNSWNLQNDKPFGKLSIKLLFARNER